MQPFLTAFSSISCQLVHSCQKNYAWLMSQLSPWETPQNSWGEVNVYGDYRDERPAREPRIHLEDAPGRNPFYIPLSPYDGIDRFTAYSGNYGENYAAAQKRQEQFVNSVLQLFNRMAKLHHSYTQMAEKWTYSVPITKRMSGICFKGRSTIMCFMTRHQW